MQFSNSAALKYDPEQGFILNSGSVTPGQVYKCTTGLENDSDSVIIEVPQHTSTSGMKPF
jgi:hypothetical protein